MMFEHYKKISTFFTIFISLSTSALASWTVSTMQDCTSMGLNVASVGIDGHQIAITIDVYNDHRTAAGATESPHAFCAPTPAETAFAELASTITGWPCQTASTPVVSGVSRPPLSGKLEVHRTSQAGKETFVVVSAPKSGSPQSFTPSLLTESVTSWESNQRPTASSTITMYQFTTGSCGTVPALQMHQGWVL